MSKIQWTDKTDNPLGTVGGGHYCEKTSQGCKFCYAERMNLTPYYKGNGQPYRARGEHPEMELKRGILDKWQRARVPKKVFVCSMTDIAGDWVSSGYVWDMFDAMKRSVHTFQILTKRPKRLYDLVTAWQESRGCYLPDNIWVGVSAEDQTCYDERVIWLDLIPAVVGFLSLEPLLGAIDLKLVGGDSINWVIVGGESGPHARPLDIEWIESIISQCKEAGVAVFIKQLGTAWAKENGAKDSKGGDPDEWPEHLRVREFPR